MILKSEQVTKDTNKETYQNRVDVHSGGLTKVEINTTKIRGLHYAKTNCR